MLHIRPLSEEQAPAHIQEVYQDIKHTFSIEMVPLLFQYIAGFEEYFFYVWEKIKTNVTSDYFSQSTEGTILFARQAVGEIYHPSRVLGTFLQGLHVAERESISQTVKKLEILNAQLLILTLGLREGVKGVTVGMHLLPKDGDTPYEEEIFDQFINRQIMENNLRDYKEDIEPASRLLAPIFGSNALSIAKYPEFFAHIALEMDELVKTENYLRKRVGLEHVGLLKVSNLSYPLGASYAEIAHLAGKKPYFHELLYILSETFPTRFPRLVITTALMQSVLHKQGNNLFVQ